LDGVGVKVGGGVGVEVAVNTLVGVAVSSCRSSISVGVDVTVVLGDGVVVNSGDSSVAGMREGVGEDVSSIAGGVDLPSPSKNGSSASIGGRKLEDG
jgi:hypothetical protein